MTTPLDAATHAWLIATSDQHPADIMAALIDLLAAEIATEADEQNCQGCATIHLFQSSVAMLADRLGLTEVDESGQAIEQEELH